MAENSSGKALVIQRVQPREPGRLALTSEAIGLDDRIGDAYSAYHDDMSPPLMWTAMPDADTYALVVEDPDAPAEGPFLHWVIWNIPGTAIGLPEGLGPHLPDTLKGAVQGRNGAGKVGYMGARPPAGHGVHRYHFQLFALDDHLPADPGMPFDELVNMLKAHTLTTGELVATYERREEP